MTTTYTAPNYSPEQPLKRYVKAALSTAPHYFWCETPIGSPGFDVRQGTAMAEDLPPEVREQADKLRGLAFGCVDWPY